MDIKTENEIRLLKKLGLDDNAAAIVALTNNGKPELAVELIEIEKINAKILQDETYKNLVPFEHTLTVENSKFIFHDIAMNEITIK